MALPRDIVEQLESFGRKARSVTSRESRLFLELGKIASTVHQLVTEHGEPQAFTAWCKRHQLARATTYKALAAWRLLGDAPGAEKQPRTVLELLGASETAALEARPLFARRLTIRDARAILERHRAPVSRLKTPESTSTAESFATTGGTVTVRFNGEPADLLGAMLQVVRQLQSAAVAKPTTTAAESPLQTSRSLLDRISGRAA